MKREREYPYYGKSEQTGTIVYFIEPSTGTVIVKSKGSWEEMIKGRTWKEYENFTIITNPEEIKKLDKKRFFLNITKKEIDSGPPVNFININFKI